MAVMTEEPLVQSAGKLFYKINEVSKITSLKPYVLRYWETEFPQLAPEKDDNEQRRYRRKDIDLIQRIKQLLYEEKFTIAGAKQRIAAEGASERKTPAASARKAAAASATVAAAASAPPAPALEVSRPAGRPHTARPAMSDRHFLKELTEIRREIEELMAFLKK